MGLLDGKSGVISGAGRGIAGATADLLAAEGAQVVIADLGVDVDGTGADTSVAQLKVDEIQAAGGEATALQANVTDSDACDSIVQTCLDTYGKIDFAITAAGILRDRALVNMSDEEWQGVIDVHLNGTFFLARAAARAMRQQRFGTIITVTSISQEGNFGQTNYSGAKGGIASMTYAMAVELSRYGVNVNSVLPSAFTRMIASIPGQEEFDVSKMQPGSAMGTAEHVAPLFAYLASDEAQRITGQVIALGGERLALWQHPREKMVITQRNGFSLEDLRRAIPATFKGRLEPSGMAQTSYREIDFEAVAAKK